MKWFAFERRWAKALLEAFAPPGDGGLAPKPGEVDYLATLDRMLRASTKKAALGTRIAVWLGGLSPLFVLGSFRTVSAFGMEARTRLLGALLRHRVFFVRELMLLLKLAACFALLGAPEVRARSRYDAILAQPVASRSVKRKLALLSSFPPPPRRMAG